MPLVVCVGVGDLLCFESNVSTGVGGGRLDLECFGDGAWGAISRKIFI